MRIIERRPFELFVASLATYSFAGERFAWLVLQPLMPLVLLAGGGAGAVGRPPGGPAGRRRGGRGGRRGLRLDRDRRELPRRDRPARAPVVVHTDRDVRDVVDRVRSLAREDPRLTVHVDASEHSQFPFAWYFRELRTGYLDMAIPSFRPEGDVLVMSRPAYELRRPGLGAYRATKFTQRRFWGREYGSLSPGDLWRWTTKRETWTPTGSLGGVLLVRRDVR